MENEDGDGKEDGDGDGGVDVGKAEIGVGNPVARSKLKSELIRKGTNHYPRPSISSNRLL